MPGSRREVANAEEEGVAFVWLSAPTGFCGHVPGIARDGDDASFCNADADADGGNGDNPVLAAVRVRPMRLGAPDVGGRQMPEPIEGADYHEPAEMVIKALGFEAEELPRLWGVDGLEVTRWGTVRASHETHGTSLPGVYAVGDIVRGASLVVWAIRDGQEAAAAILADLSAVRLVAAQ